MVFSEKWWKMRTIHKQEEESTSTLRTLLAQVLAVTAKNLIVLDLGMTLAMPTIAIPALLKAEGNVSLTLEEASWFGSIALICQPPGAFISGLLFEPIGRKKSMMAVNIPHIIGWFLLYFANSAVMLFLAAVLMGVGIGFMEAPIVTYVGEVSEPKWRGFLTLYSGLFVTIGFVFVFLLGTAVDWQTACLICSFVPMLAIIAIYHVPESPIWLLSKGRTEEAEKALCWLRGWVSPSAIKTEFTELIQYNETMKLSKKVNVSSVDTEARESGDLTAEKTNLKKVVSFLGVADLFRRQTFLPLVMNISFFIFMQSAGIIGTRPFLIEIFDEFGSPMDKYWATVLTSIISLLGNVICMFVVKCHGKRIICLLSITGCAITNCLLSIYSTWFLQSTIKWLPVTLFILSYFSWYCGLAHVPWILTSEIFPFRGRGLASGVAAAFCYILGFIFSKTYINLHENFGLAGAFGFYTLWMLAALVYFYYFLPETEGKSLEEIEKMLDNKFLKLQKRFCK